MNKTFEELGFKPGDSVRCVAVRGNPCYKVGDILEVSDAYDAPFEGYYPNGVNGDWELVKWSDWIMANPGVTIPDNAVVAKAEDGSVVCFKVPVEPKWDPSAIWFLPC